MCHIKACIYEKPFAWKYTWTTTTTQSWHFNTKNTIFFCVCNNYAWFEDEFSLRYASEKKKKWFSPFDRLKTIPRIVYGLLLFFLSFSSRMYGLSSSLALDIHFAEKIWMQIQSLFTYSFKSTRTKKKRCGSIWTNRNKSLQGLHHKINQHTYFFFSNRYIFIFRLMQMRRSNSLFFFTFVVLFFAFVRIVSSPFLFTAQKNKRPEYFRVYEHLFG